MTLPSSPVGRHHLSVCCFPRAVLHSVSLELMECPLVVSSFYFITPRAESEATSSPLGCRWWVDEGVALRFPAPSWMLGPPCLNCVHAGLPDVIEMLRLVPRQLPSGLQLENHG